MKILGRRGSCRRPATLRRARGRPSRRSLLTTASFLTFRSRRWTIAGSSKHCPMSRVDGTHTPCLWQMLYGWMLLSLTVRWWRCNVVQKSSEELECVCNRRRAGTNLCHEINNYLDNTSSIITGGYEKHQSWFMLGNIRYRFLGLFPQVDRYLLVFTSYSKDLYAELFMTCRKRIPRIHVIQCLCNFAPLTLLVVTKLCNYYTYLSLFIFNSVVIFLFIMLRLSDNFSLSLSFSGQGCVGWK